jgi:hypothetical protein
VKNKEELKEAVSAMIRDNKATSTNIQKLVDEALICMDRKVVMETLQEAVDDWKSNSVVEGICKTVRSWQE